jgi:hypothetical protein
VQTVKEDGYNIAYIACATLISKLEHDNADIRKINKLCTPENQLSVIHFTPLIRHNNNDFLTILKSNARRWIYLNVVPKVKDFRDLFCYKSLCITVSKREKSISLTLCCSLYSLLSTL